MIKNLVLLCCLILSSATSEGTSVRKQHCGGAIAKDQYATSEGVRIHYKTIGHGREAIVFVHGWICSAEFWSQSITAFPEYRVIAIDLPGHGQSDKPQTVYSMGYFARSIEAVMNDANVDHAVLVGHSMGTPIVRQFYRLNPQRTLGLVIVDGSLMPPKRKDVLRVAGELRANYRENAAKYVEDLIGPIRDTHLRKRIGSLMLATPDYVGIGAVEGLIEDSVRTNNHIDVPVLAVLADASGWEPNTEASFRAVAPNLEFRLWGGVSHFLMMEKPSAFNEELRQFIVSNNLLPAN